MQTLRITGEGISVGAMSLINKTLKDWMIYKAIPADTFKEKKRITCKKSNFFKQNLNFMDQDIRWLQRYENFKKAFNYLGHSLSIKEPSDTERAGIIQFYEIAFELAWKTLKDILTEEGYTVRSPREAIKIAFQAGYIVHGQIWLEALEDRNLTVHTYDENTAMLVLGKIQSDYYPILNQFNQWVHQQIK